MKCFAWEIYYSHRGLRLEHKEEEVRYILYRNQFTNFLNCFSFLQQGTILQINLCVGRCIHEASVSSPWISIRVTYAASINKGAWESFWAVLLKGKYAKGSLYSLGLGCSLRVCVSNKLPGDVHTSASQTTFGIARSRESLI